MADRYFAQAKWPVWTQHGTSTDKLLSMDLLSKVGYCSTWENYSSNMGT